MGSPATAGVMTPIYWRRPASPGCAALAIDAELTGGDPLRPAAPRSRSTPNSLAATRFARLRRARDRRRTHWRRPASPGCAALAIDADLTGGDPLRPAAPRSRSTPISLAATRFARLRRARDRRRYSLARDPLRPAAPRSRSTPISLAPTRFARLRRARDRRRSHWRRPASPGCAALAIDADLTGADPLRPAAPRSRSTPRSPARPPALRPHPSREPGWSMAVDGTGLVRMFVPACGITRPPWRR